LNTFFNRLMFIFNNGGVNYRTKKFWKFLLLYLSLIITVGVLPGGINIMMVAGHAIIIFHLRNTIIDKSNLLNSLTMHNRKKVFEIYKSMFVFLIVFNVLILIVHFLFKYTIMVNEDTFEYRFNSLKEFFAFLILYLVLFFFTAPLCFIKKNGIWFAWFFGFNILFICIINLLKRISGLNSYILIGSILLIPTIIISFKASCYFNRPKRYILLQNQDKSITI